MEFNTEFKGLIYIVHLVVYFHGCITMHGFINVSFLNLIRICFWGNFLSILAMFPFLRRVVLHKIILCHKFTLTGTKEDMKDISLIHFL